PLTLADAVQKGLQNRMEMRAFEQRAKMTEHELKANQLRYIPQVSAGVDLKYNAILATSIVPIGALNPGNPTDEVAAVRFGTNWANGGGLSLSQVIYDPTIKGAHELAELNGQLTEAQKAQRAEAIALAVAQAYYALLISEAEVGYAQSDSLVAAAKIKDLRERLSEGRALQTDLEAAQLDSASARLRMADIRRNAADWRAQLAYQMGIGPENGGTIVLAEALGSILETRSSTLETENANPVPSTASQLLHVKMRQTMQQRVNEKAGYKPSIFLNGYLGANHFSDAFDPWNGDKWFPTSYVGLSLSLPLTEGFIRQQRIQRLDANLLADKMDLDASQHQTDLEFERAKIALQSAQEALVMQMQMQELAQKRLALAQARLAADRGLTTEVIQAENQVQSARFQSLRRGYDVLMADLEMRRVCGMLKF
ncbi:MAG: hypothetical protein RLZZ519_3042, partial [Bacteroidota bacterium]